MRSTMTKKIFHLAQRIQLYSSRFSWLEPKLVYQRPDTHYTELQYDSILARCCVYRTVLCLFYVHVNGSNDFEQQLFIS